MQSGIHRAINYSYQHSEPATMAILSITRSPENQVLCSCHNNSSGTIPLTVAMARGLRKVNTRSWHRPSHVFKNLLSYIEINQVITSGKFQQISSFRDPSSTTRHKCPRKNDFAEVATLDARLVTRGNMIRQSLIL